MQYFLLCDVTEACAGCMKCVRGMQAVARHTADRIGVCHTAARGVSGSSTITVRHTLTRVQHWLRVPACRAELPRRHTYSTPRTCSSFPKCLQAKSRYSECSKYSKCRVREIVDGDRTLLLRTCSSSDFLLPSHACVHASTRGKCRCPPSATCMHAYIHACNMFTCACTWTWTWT